MSDTTTSQHRNDTQAAIDAGLALGEPRALESGVSAYSVIVPRDAHHALVRVPVPDPEREPFPMRARATYRPATVDALSAVITRFEDADNTTIWVHPDNGRVVAIFNDSSDSRPGWRDHSAVLQLQATDEWKHWVLKDGSLMGQQAFAEHIEHGIPEIIDPPAAVMLELAQTFHAHSNVTFRSAIRIDSGQVQAQYDEVVEASAGAKRGDILIPQTFDIAVSPFVGEDRYPLTARLRYRVNAGVLTLGYKLERPTDVVRACLTEIADKLATSHTAPVFIGEPGS